MSDILCFSPTYEGKSYALAQWKAAYEAQTVASDLLIVDNSRNSRYHLDVLAVEFPYATIFHNYRRDSFEFTWQAAWRTGIFYAWEMGYIWLWSYESDVIVPPQALETLLAAEPDPVDTWHICLPNPQRGGDGSDLFYAMGCTLYSVSNLFDAAISFERSGRQSWEGWLRSLYDNDYGGLRKLRRVDLPPLPGTLHLRGAGEYDEFARFADGS